MEDKIKNIVATVFEIPVEEINDNLSPDTIESWDSIKHMQLVVALEEEFDVQFTDEEIGDMLNFSLIKIITSDKL